MSTSTGATSKHYPRDAQVIISILKDMGVVEFEPQTITQLLEFTYRYITSTLEEARAYATHANKKMIDIEDVQLAVQMQLDKNFTTPPPRDMLLEVARNKNSVPLPQIRSHCGIRLPPDRYCMTACNYELKSNKKILPATKSSSLFSNNPSSLFKPQIKPSIKRTIQTVARTQSITIPKPVIKLAPASPIPAAFTPPDNSQQQWKANVQQTVQQPVVQTLMDIDEPPACLIKRQLSDDEL